MIITCVQCTSTHFVFEETARRPNTKVFLLLPSFMLLLMAEAATLCCSHSFLKLHLLFVLEWTKDCDEQLPARGSRFNQTLRVHALFSEHAVTNCT